MAAMTDAMDKLLSLKAQRAQQLADNEMHRALEAQEGKLRQIQKSVLYLSSFVQSKSAESDYAHTQQAVLDIVEQVNQHLQKQMHTNFAGAL